MSAGSVPLLTLPALNSRSSSLQPTASAGRSARSPLQVGATSVLKSARAFHSARSVPAVNGRREPDAPLIPGSARWLHDEVSRSEQRGQQWIMSRTPSEKKLREFIRVPVEEVGGPKSSSRDAQLRQRQQYTEKVQRLLDNAGRYMDTQAPVAIAGRHRVKCVQHLGEPDTDQMVQPLPPPKPQVSSSGAMQDGTDSDAHANNRGLSRSERPRFVRLAERAQTVSIQEVASSKEDEMQDLVAYLVEGASSDEERAWAVFCWICHNIGWRGMEQEEARKKACEALETALFSEPLAGDHVRARQKARVALEAALDMDDEREDAAEDEIRQRACEALDAASADQSQARQRARDALEAALDADDAQETTRVRAREALELAMFDELPPEDQAQAMQRARDALEVALDSDNDSATAEEVREKAYDALEAVLLDELSPDERETARQTARAALEAALDEDDLESTASDAARLKACAALEALLLNESSAEEEEETRRRARNALEPALHLDKPRKFQISDKVMQVFQSRIGTSSGFAELFQVLGTEAGLSVRTLTGTYRGLASSRESKHSWNAVFLGKEWILVDSVLGAGFGSHAGRHFRPYYFGPRAVELVFSHLPKEPQWQLLETPLNRRSFRDQPQIDPNTFFGHQLGFWPESRPAGKLTVPPGASSGSICLTVPPETRLSAELNGEAAWCFQRMAGEAVEAGLQVIIMEARRLRNADVVGHSDPYCICQLRGKPSTKFSTRVIWDTGHAKWQETCKFPSCMPDDVIEFRIYDKDFGSKDDLLGTASVPVGPCLAGKSFDGELELDDDGMAGSTLRVRVDPLSVDRVAVAAGEENVTTLHFRVPLGPSEHRLDLFARPVASKESPRRACTFTVDVADGSSDNGTTPRLIFPEVDWDVFREHGLAFPEALPVGVVTLEPGSGGLLERRLYAPAGIVAAADVDGDTSAAFVQRDRGCLVVWACCTETSRELRICVRGGVGDYRPAITYQLAIPPGCGSPTIPHTHTYPEVTPLANELGAYLEAPYSGHLISGKQRFGIHVDGELVERIVVASSDGLEIQPLSDRGGGLFDGEVTVRPPGVKLLAQAPLGDPEAVFLFHVQPK